MARKLWIVVLFVLSAILFVFFMCGSLFVRITVPSGSMEPTIPAGSKLLVRRGKTVKRGDLVMFYSDEESCYMIKRLIGEPGDIIDIRQGTVYVNGVFLNEPDVGSYSEDSGIYCIPEDSYFFLGDNRADSDDSREWQNPYVYKGQIIGRAVAFISPEFKIIKQTEDLYAETYSN